MVAEDFIPENRSILEQILEIAVEKGIEATPIIIEYMKLQNMGYNSYKAMGEIYKRYYNNYFGEEIDEKEV